MIISRHTVPPCIHAGKVMIVSGLYFGLEEKTVTFIVVLLAARSPLIINVPFFSSHRLPFAEDSQYIVVLFNVQGSKFVIVVSVLNEMLLTFVTGWSQIEPINSRSPTGFVYTALMFVVTPDAYDFCNTGRVYDSSAILITTINPITITANSADFIFLTVTSSLLLCLLQSFDSLKSFTSSKSLELRKATGSRIFLSNRFLCWCSIQFVVKLFVLL